MKGLWIELTRERNYLLDVELMLIAEERLADGEIVKEDSRRVIGHGTSRECGGGSGEMSTI